MLSHQRTWLTEKEPLQKKALVFQKGPVCARLSFFGRETVAETGSQCLCRAVHLELGLWLQNTGMNRVNIISAIFKPPDVVMVMSS